MNKRLLRILIPLVALILLAVSVIPSSACGYAGCTKTIGYWKTHSSYGPAPYDTTWDVKNEDAIFYFSGLTNIQILWKAPRGNAYYIFAKQWIGANLNLISGADAPPEVWDALGWGYTYFGTYTPAAGNKAPVRAQAIYYAGILDKYNKGEIGPGHCAD
jgi:hypothetical protein